MIPVQQLHPHLAFELGDPLRNRRLGGVETLAGPTETAERHHPQERLDRLEVHHPAPHPMDKFSLSKLIKK
jgi:hypothetical protein